MTPSFRSQITDELLSAYIDGEVNSDEARLVENAIAADPEIAWQVDSLRRTVEMIAQLPAVALPQTFAISELQVADVVATRRAALRSRDGARSASGTDEGPEGLWQRLLTFFSGGNLLLRNAATLAVVAFLAVMAGDLLTATPRTLSVSTDAAPPVAVMESQAAPKAAPGTDEQDIVAQDSAQDSAQDGVAQNFAVEESALPEAESALVQPTALTGQADARLAPAPAQESAPGAEADALIPDPSPLSLAEGQPVGGGGAGGVGMGGGGGGAAPPPPAPAAAADSSSSEIAAASLTTVQPSADSSAEPSAEAPIGAAAVSQAPLAEPAASMPATVQTEAATPQALAAAPLESAPAEESELTNEPVAETVSETVAEPMAAQMAEPVTEPVAEMDAAAVEESAIDLQPAAAQSVDSPAELTDSSLPEAAAGDNVPFSALRIAQIVLGLLALLLSSLWVQSR